MSACLGLVRVPIISPGDSLSFIFLHWPTINIQWTGRSVKVNLSHCFKDKNRCYYSIRILQSIMKITNTFVLIHWKQPWVHLTRNWSNYKSQTSSRIPKNSQLPNVVHLDKVNISFIGEHQWKRSEAKGYANFPCLFPLDVFGTAVAPLKRWLPLWGNGICNVASEAHSPFVLCEKICSISSSLNCLSDLCP